MNRRARFWALALTLSNGPLDLACHRAATSQLEASVDAQSVEAASAPPQCDAVATFADGKTPSQVRHVATTGNDTSGDGSAAAPFLTIARAAQAILPGTAIYVHAGVHQGGTFLVGLQGRETQPIWIMGAPGEPRPVIQGGSEGLHLVKPRYVVLQHLEFANTLDHGVSVDDGDDVSNPEAARFLLFLGLDIHDTGTRPSGVPNCLKMAGVNDFSIVNSRFARCGAGPDSGAVGVGGVGVHRGTVNRNRFLANGYGGVQLKGGSADIEVSRNLFQETGWRGVNMGGSTGAAFFRPPLSTSVAGFEAARIRVSANVFTGSEAAAAFTGCVDCEFSHNTVINPSKWALRILQETTARELHTFARAAGGVIADNIFYFRRADLNAGEDINVGADTDSRTFRLARNLWYAHDEPAQSGPRLPRFAGAQAESVVGTDPLFVKVSAGEFQVSQRGVTAGAGTACLGPAPP